MSQNTINFESLKYNLYEVLGIENNTSEHKIKKAFRNLILNFHPDKKNNIEEDVYYHIVTANQILTNTTSRKKYDEFLNKIQDTHNDLKKQFKKIKNELKLEINETDALQEFKKKFKELDKKHFSTVNDNININDNSDSNNDSNNDSNTDSNNDSDNNDKIISAYNKLIKDRESGINIQKEDIKSANDFNQIFENKINSGHFNDQLIPVNENMKLSTINVNDNYTSLDIAFDNLYIEGGGINTNKYSSLDSAFKIQSLNTKEFSDVNIKDAINNYNNETNKLSNIDYSKDLFESW